MVGRLLLASLEYGLRRLDSTGGKAQALGLRCTGFHLQGPF